MTSGKSDIDNDGLWGWWHDKVKKDNRLYMKAAHKALNIPEDDMLDASNSNNRIGITYKEILVFGILGLALLFGWHYMNKETEKESSPPAAVTSPDSWMDLAPDPFP